MKGAFCLKKRYNPYMLPPWLRKFRAVCDQFIIPFCLFQGIRTIIIPTTFDVIFLFILIVLALALKMEFI